jgi:uncharacterized protein with ParB-like and HNH nuclease domain
MSYETALTVKNVIEKIHKKEYLLPTIQREFVWNTYQIERLFDSLMRDYPISSFLFWEVDKENVNNYEFYEFIREFHEKDNRHNPKASINGDDKITAILDGQQRLTSLYIALKGSYAYKLPRKRYDNPDAYPKRKLYLNLISKSSEDELEYNFSFLTEKEVIQDENNFWFLVGDILKLEEPGDVNSYLIENEIFTKYNKEQANFANNALFKLRNVIMEKGILSYYKETSQSLDKVLNIFIRINSGGTKLSYSDLLLSIATAQWETKDAREEIITIVDEINDIGNGFNVEKDFILKSSLILSDFRDFAFKVDNFNKSNMLQIEKNWENITKALKLAVKLVSSFGYDRETLTSNNALIPIAYYLYKKQASDSFVTSNSNIEDKKKIRKWLVLSLIKRTFSGQPDNVLRPIRELIQQNNAEEFPLDKIIDKFKGTNKTLIFSDEDIENLTFYTYGQGFTFSVLSLLYPTLDFRNKFHIDHIFPKSLFKKSLLKKRGLSDEEIETFQDYVNYIGNLQLLEAIPNIEKQDTEFKEWLDETYPNDVEKKEYCQKHYIPQNISLDFNNFINFFEEREKLMINELKNKLQ